MNRVLVDTSVWVDHFRSGKKELIDLLQSDRAMTHPLVLGEIACGTPPNRTRTLADIADLDFVHQATVRETMAFIDRHQLFGMGCGLIDLQLLASTLLTPNIALWTSDKRLRTLAEKMDVQYFPLVH